MKINTHDNFVIVKEKINDLENFVFLLEPLMPNQFKDKNLIIDLLDYKSMTLKDLFLFQNVSDSHKKSNKSFVIVNNILNPNELSDTILVVPSLQEAEDLIEMEEIERELGF